MEQHKLYFQRGINEDYWIEYSVTEDESGRPQFHPVKVNYLTIDKVISVLGRNEGLPWKFFEAPVEVSFNADQNDPIPEEEKQAIKSLVEMLHTNSLEKRIIQECKPGISHFL